MNGVINVYKEQGCTSFQVVAKIRRLSGIKKCGHTGTLDPMAEGVLPICLGYATRFSDLLTATDKQYIADFKLGTAYDSYDTTGSMTAESDIIPSEEEIRVALASLTGLKSLRVPAFSAKKIDGERAYKLARKGEIQDAGTAEMRIDKIELVSYSHPDGVIVVDCGKGTYIRSIINELGALTGVCAAMSGLVRTKSGPFDVKNALRLDALEALAAEGRLAEAVRRVEDIIPLKKAVVKDSAVKVLLNGVSLRTAEYLSLPVLSEGEEIFLMDHNGRLLALGTGWGRQTPVKTEKVFR